MQKRYRRVEYIFENVIEVYEYLDGRYGAKGQPREKKRKATPEEVKKRNQWNRERLARHKLRQHFKKNDYLVTLTYRREARPPDMISAKEDFKKFMRKVREKYAKKGYRAKWLRNIEVGTKGAWHIHLIINRIEDADITLKEAWPHGSVQFQLLYEKGEFADLAAYITKTPETDPRLKDASYSAAKDLPVPEPKKKRFVRWKKVPTEKKGFYIDKQSYFEGKNEVTGYKYRYYTLIRLNRRI